MSVTNPQHLSEGKKMRVLSSDGAFTATLLVNDPTEKILRFEIREGAFVSIPYDEFLSANVFLEPARDPFAAEEKHDAARALFEALTHRDVHRLIWRKVEAAGMHPGSQDEADITWCEILNLLRSKMEA